MIKEITQILENNDIERIGIINIDECEVINQRIMPEWAKSAIIFCIPYRAESDAPNDGFSEYARVYDYHNFSKNLYKTITNQLNDSFNFNFEGFCDHSPINEKLAAAKCGLGFIGRNSLFFDNIYGSYVFLGSIITDYICDIKPCEIKTCDNCGLCIEKCPGKSIVERGINRDICLSAISQKKRKTSEEYEILKKHNIVWGCDICQSVCPHNKAAKIKPLPYFKETRIANINKEFIMSLSDEEFNKYAFSYKGRQIVLNNMEFKDINP